MRTMVDLCTRLDVLGLGLVTSGEWGVSYETSSDLPGVKLHVYKGRGADELCPECNGTIHNTRAEATSLALDHGHLKFYQDKFLRERETWRWALHNVSHAAHHAKLIRNEQACMVWVD